LLFQAVIVFHSIALMPPAEEPGNKALYNTDGFSEAERFSRNAEGGVSKSNCFRAAANPAVPAGDR
jgi:hypothetical protein